MLYAGATLSVSIPTSEPARNAIIQTAQPSTDLATESSKNSDVVSRVAGASKIKMVKPSLSSSLRPHPNQWTGQSTKL